jgi:tetratricopeptide (TPR) repeat protein
MIGMTMKVLALCFCLMATLAVADETSFRDYQRKPYIISGSEVEKIREEIRTQCRLPKAQEMDYPWYYHYEVGLAMQKKQDWQRALDSFLAALDRRDRPSRSSRIYGMWFIDYYPYYNIGLAHYHLGNWKCAIQSFRLSQMLENIPADSIQSYRLRELGMEAEQQLQQQ